MGGGGTVGIAVFNRQEAENDAIDPRDSRSLAPEEEEDGQEGWRINPFHGFAGHLAARPRQPIIDQGNTELERWFREPCIYLESTQSSNKPTCAARSTTFQLSVKWPTITAQSLQLAPSERLFSIAGNLISEKRTRICSENVRHVLCLRIWGLLGDDDDDEVIQIDDNDRILHSLDPPDPNIVPDA